MPLSLLLCVKTPPQGGHSCQALGMTPPAQTSSSLAGPASEEGALSPSPLASLEKGPKGERGWGGHLSQQAMGPCREGAGGGGRPRIPQQEWEHFTRSSRCVRR